MGLYALATAAPAATEKFYLDTSAIYPLAWAEGVAKGGAPALRANEALRVALLSAFLKKAEVVGSEMRTSLLSLEEIGTKIRNGERKDLIRANGFPDWHAYRQARPVDAAADALVIQAKAVQWMEWTVSALLSYGVLFERRAISTPALATTMIKKARLTYLELLRNYVDLDAMDALHIVVGKEIGAGAFISFDAGWQSVAEIDVYHG